jgi:cyclase
MSATEAAMDIALNDYSSWGDAERIVINVDALYREFSDDKSPANVLELFELMAKLSKNRKYITP